MTQTQDEDAKAKAKADGDEFPRNYEHGFLEDAEHMTPDARVYAMDTEQSEASLTE